MSSPLSDTETQTYFEKERLMAALSWEKSDKTSEHHVARYVLLIILKVFNMLEWNIVPQFYTYAGKWPDIVLESFDGQPGKERNYLFVPRVFIELKHKNNADDPIKQLLESVKFNQSSTLSSKGYLIVIKGKKWTIMDFQLVIPDNASNPQTLSHNFYENPYNMDERRPTPSKAYAEREGIDISTEQGFYDMVQPLRWIAENKESRDFAGHKQHVNRLPDSLTNSALPRFEQGDEDNLREFSYMGELL
jgi:hypothetical protein